MKNQEGIAALHFAAMGGSQEVVTALIKGGGDPDIRDSKGYTALHLAAGYGQKQAVLALFDAGAKVKTTWYGESPADSARANPRNAAIREDLALMDRLEFNITRDDFWS